RASVSAKPYNSGRAMERSPRMAGEVPEERQRERDQPACHPRHQQQKADQKRRQSWNGAERTVLQRRDDLNEVDDDADKERQQQQRCADQRRRKQRMAKKLDNGFRCHKILNRNSSSVSRPPDSI